MISLLVSVEEKAKQKNVIDSIAGTISRYKMRIGYWKDPKNHNDSMAEKLKKWEAKLQELENIKGTEANTSATDFDKECSLLKSFANNINDANERKWYIQNVRILQQFTNLGSTLEERDKLRDKYMAENFLWIKEQNPDSKLIIWAHNIHIQKNKGFQTGYRMGHYLDSALKTDYIAVAYTFHQGSYLASGDKGISSYHAQTSNPGTYEYYFHCTGKPIFLLDLRKIDPYYIPSQYLNDHLQFRVIGAVQSAKEFFYTYILKDFDMIVFIDQSTPSTLLHERKVSGQ